MPNWLVEFYQYAGRETTLAFTVLNDYHRWALTLTIALLTAIALGKDVAPAPLPFIVILGSSLLLFRFFVRSSIGYVNLYRWNTLTSLIVKYWRATGSKEESEAWKSLEKAIEIYYVQWKSPIRLSKIVWDNLRLAFLWLGIVILGLVIWTSSGAFECRFTMLVLALWAVGMGLEIYWFVTYRMFRFASLDV